jgi:hypothetical protein
MGRMHPILMQLTLDYILFLDLVSSEDLNDDLAVQQSESTVALLEQLDAGERQEFVQFVQNAIQAESAELGETYRVRAMKNLPRSFGWD